MRVHLTLHGFDQKHQELDLPDEATAADAARALHLHPDSTLIFRADQPLPDDAPLRDGDHLRIIRTISGGRR